MPHLEEALERLLIFADLGITRAVNGAVSHPPDGNPLIGPAPGVRDYGCCCGTQIGIGWGPGLSRELARWIVQRATDISTRMKRGFTGARELSHEVTLAKTDALRFARTDTAYLGRDRTLNPDLRWACAYLEIEPNGHGGPAVLRTAQ